MRKIGLILLSAALLVILGACSSGNSAKEKKRPVTRTATEKMNKPIVVNGMELTVSQEKTRSVKAGKQIKDLYGFKIRGENISNAKVGLGSIDFVLLTSDGKEVSIDDSLETFGNEIEKK
ncbi:hypothetical protein MFLO_08947 [Listeria floridensis FSL S10-1187]|uniref:Lipoprotein n=1 Tax=Listeria floridensis FSL S10-1187 TaxID=1265817 RepID=A0ABP3AZQ7_9LIST|nr:hypothetical protein [Listeria floridensis]EUJ31340.1 hypothetical protein MFLO_08947 [Listeria floridensis FSL S10-1187]